MARNAVLFNWIPQSFQQDHVTTLKVMPAEFNKWLETLLKELLEA